MFSCRRLNILLFDTHIAYKGSKVLLLMTHIFLQEMKHPLFITYLSYRGLKVLLLRAHILLQEMKHLIIYYSYIA
jgi:hypothetical protein